VHLPAIVEEDTGDIHIIIGPVIGDKEKSIGISLDMLKTKWYGPHNYKIIRKTDVPKGQKIIYLRIVVDVRNHKLSNSGYE